MNFPKYALLHSDALQAPGVNGVNNHPTVKPVRLMRYLVRLVTPPGGLVLDPFVGSGTTGVAARKEKVRFIGIDSDKSALEIAKQRVGGKVKVFVRAPR